eukprot:764527-Hanusia_phi.AAC.2
MQRRVGRGEDQRNAKINGPPQKKRRRGGGGGGVQLLLFGMRAGETIRRRQISARRLSGPFPSSRSPRPHPPFQPFHRSLVLLGLVLYHTVLDQLPSDTMSANVSPLLSPLLFSPPLLCSALRPPVLTLCACLPEEVRRL